MSGNKHFLSQFSPTTNDKSRQNLLIFSSGIFEMDRCWITGVSILLLCIRAYQLVLFDGRSIAQLSRQSNFANIGQGGIAPGLVLGKNRIYFWACSRYQQFCFVSCWRLQFFKLNVLLNTY